MPLFTILFQLLLIRIKEMPTCKSCFNKFTSLGKVEHKYFVPYTLYIFSILWILQLGTCHYQIGCFYAQLDCKCSVYALVI